MIDVPVNLPMPHVTLMAWWAETKEWITYADYVFRVARLTAEAPRPRQARLQFGRKPITHESRA